MTYSYRPIMSIARPIMVYRIVSFSMKLNDR